jgi:hypothetical protein
MFLRHTKRKKDGKEHRYRSIVENRRVGGGRVVQRLLLYLGEINDSQELAWRKSIAIQDGIKELERTARLGLAGAMITEIRSSTGATTNPSTSRTRPPPRRSTCH